MLIRNFNFKNLLKEGALGVCIFAVQSFSYASQANPMPLVMSDHLLGLQPSAGTLIVDNSGVGSETSNQVEMPAYTSTDCTTGSMGGATTAYLGFPTITWTPQTYNILATAVYGWFVNPTAGNMSEETVATVHSFGFGPLTFSGTLYIFNPTHPCFRNVTCNTNTHQCTGSWPQTVSLVDPG